MKKYIAIAAALLLAAALYLFHHYAARQAEEELDHTLRNWVAESDPTAGIQFSEVEISPFSGTLTIYDLNIFTDRHLQRGSEMRFHLGYPMFLRIYLGNVSDALDRELSMRAYLENTSWMDRYRLREIKFDTLVLDYRGNPVDLLQNALQGTSFRSRQQLDAEGRGFAWSEPFLNWGAVRADSLRLHRDIPAGSSSLWPSGSLELELQPLTWRPPQWFTDTYGFFIRGFEYSGDAIPLRSFATRMSYGESSQTVRIEQMGLLSEHVRMELEGGLPLQEPAGNTPLEGITLKLTDYSDRFRGVLDGINRLFRLNLAPASADSLMVPLGGTLGSPSLRTRAN